MAVAYASAGGVGVEGVLDENGDILVEYRIDGGRINDLGSEIAELHSLGE